MAATAPSLGTAQSFAVLGFTAVTSTGPTIISGGDLGVGPSQAITGFPPGIVVPPGAIHAGDAVALQGLNDATTAYSNLAGQPCTSDLTGQNLGGMTLVPGVYCFSSSAQLTGILTLDAQNTVGAVFIFKTGSTLTTASNASVRVINGGSACNVFWQIGSSATLGTNTSFAGNLIAAVSITLNTGTSLSGRAIARGGAVTLDANPVSSAGCAMLMPTPTSTPTATVPAATQTAIAATQTVIAATSTVPAATQTVIAATQTVIAATATVPAATQTVIAATQTAPAATQAAIAATQTVIAATQTGMPRNTPATTPTATPNTSSARAPVNTRETYRVPPNGIPFFGNELYSGPTPTASVSATLGAFFIVGAIPTPSVAVIGGIPTPGAAVVATRVPASATATSTAVATRMPTATVVVPQRMPNIGGGGTATTFTGTTDAHRGVDMALWITLAALLTLTSVRLVRTRLARR